MTDFTDTEMNKYGLHYQIAGVHICILSDGILEDEPQWSKFRLQADTPVDHTFTVHWAEELKLPDVQPIHETETVCRYPGSLRLYRLRSSAPFHAAAISGKNVTRITVLKRNAPWGQNPQQLFELLSLPRLLVQKNRLLIHGAYIETEGTGIVFSAASGTGKSTQAKLWERYKGARIINGDRVAVGLDNGVLRAWGVPVSGTSGCCENLSFPLKAIVILSQAKQNAVKKLCGEEAFAALSENAYFAPTFSEALPPHYSTILSVSESDSIWHMACLPDESAVKALSSALKHSQKCNF